MASPQRLPDFFLSLRVRMGEGRAQTDSMFRYLPPNSFYERPIEERHRLIFYLGHLETFDWNLLSKPLGLGPCHPSFDKLFSFGIDPVGGGLPTDTPGDWPTIAQVEQYNSLVRRRLDEALQDAHVSQLDDDLLADGSLLNVAIEHRLMHAETLAYLLHNLPLDKKISMPHFAGDPSPAPVPRMVTIPAGIATLGCARSARSAFGWDNEFGLLQLAVPSFSVDVYPVSNAEYLKFVQDGGYSDSRHWKPDDWEWIREHRIEHPHFWISRSSAPASDPDTRWLYRAMFGIVPLPLSWPVYVSHAEASAYARWAARKLPTEAQWHRAAYATPEGMERTYPWGDAAPDNARGNFHHQRWDATPVDAHPAGASAFGVADLLGNGWEWTSTEFGPFPGFEPFPFYRGYSADFFDGRHFVMKGGSPRTDACMLRRSFRNWFQPHYPHVYATFRCVEE